MSVHIILDGERVRSFTGGIGGIDSVNIKGVHYDIIEVCLVLEDPIEGSYYNVTVVKAGVDII